MAKAATKYVCSECGYECAKWMGKCPSCGEWNTLCEEKVEPVNTGMRSSRPSAGFDAKRVRKLSQITAEHEPRIASGIEEFDRVLGGGIVKGSVVLASGEPGIGKSTLFLQIAERLSRSIEVLYISGEESSEQVRLRAERLGGALEVSFLAETQLSEITAAIESVRPQLVVMDSIQTIYDTSLSSAPGSVSQVRECATVLSAIAKKSGVAMFMIGHVTKDGGIAGPRVLEHLVDTVLYFEGERNSTFRLLRAVKNRFGSTNEIGVFEMGDSGMREVKNPSELLIENRSENASGACIFCAVEGTRPLLLEVEALVSATSFGMPRRLATGLDFNRMNLVTAVLEKKVGLRLADQDIYVNISGGIRLMEPAADLAIAASIVSSFRSKPIPKGTAFFGEIGLTGDIRHISQADKRVREAARMGIEKIVMPLADARTVKESGVRVVGVKNISDALAEMFRQ